jgi:D-arabinan exo alpha-(1,3)/(1,5)-arabinofuranosidase (non-reducing end)
MHMQRIGSRAYMRSTYDRFGGNETADASHFLFANEEDYNVTLDVVGRGALYFFRANHWHGSPWHFVVDGTDNIVRETGTSDPVNAKERFTKTNFIPETSFPEPLAWTWGTTKGADLIWTPVPFENSFRIAYSRTRYGTGYYIYKLYANEDNLSQTIKGWELNDKPDEDVLNLIEKSGTDIAPKGIKKKEGIMNLSKESRLAGIKSSNSVVRAFKLWIPIDKAILLERSKLVITWDDLQHPSIEAPLGLFFGVGTFYNRDKKEFLVKGFPVNIHFDYKNNIIELACYYPMPFFKSASFEVINTEPVDVRIQYEIRYEPLTIPANLSSYFHASYKDFPEPVAGHDMVFLDTKGIEGYKEWSGNFAGTSFIFSHNGVLNTLEGDPRFFFDDSETPQAYGTGTEEWGGGGDYWGGQNMTLPFAGHPQGVGRDRNEAKDEKDLIESAYRFLVADNMPFGRRAVIRFEHGAENLSSEHYESVTYWYGLPAPSLIKTDSIDIGNPESEMAHNYYSPEASDVDTVESRYEWGIDFFPHSPSHMPKNIYDQLFPEYEGMIGEEIFPAHKKYGRITSGESYFTVRLEPDNLGVLLRRTLDYSYPNQTAEVYIYDISDGQIIDIKNIAATSWEMAGIWYLAGSNTVFYSNPKGELEKRELRTKTSNRRFRDDEFMIPANLTKNSSQIAVKIKFLPNDQHLFPEFPFPKESIWSEFSYDVFNYVLPKYPKK